jgi:uncharacterized protein YggE
MPENSPENSTPRPTNLITIGVLVIALAAVFFVGRSFGDDDSPVAAATRSTETFGIVTSGEGKISAAPDQLSFSASVSNTKPTTAAALAATNHDVRAVTISAKKAGVAAKDIQTTSLTVRPKYDYSSRSRQLVGYTATERVRIMVRTLDKAGETVGDVTNAAGNAVSISSIALSFSNQAELIAQARTKAVKKSKAAAEALAEAAGRDVGELEFVAEVTPQRYGCCYDGLNATGDMAFAKAVPAAALASSVPFSPGKSQVSVTVQVRWSLDR